VKAKKGKCLTCARNARVCSRAQECHAAHTLGKDARTAEEREGAADAAAGSDGRDTKMRVARSRWTRNKRRGVARLRAKRAKKSLSSLQCADARPDPHNTALFPLSRRIYHRT